MCGIFGVKSHALGEGALYGALSAMAGQLDHRGPDQAGGVIDAGEGVALGACRLSIIDVEHGRQPMQNEDGRIWAVLNGEIFDYQKHIAALSARGHRFRTRCDSEVVVHAYEEYGPDFVHQLDGQFAIALWDASAEQLWLFRDRFGICPLFYARDKSGSFLFASEAKAIFATDLVTPRLDPQGIDQVFSFWTNVPGRTCFEEVREVKPAHRVVVDRSQGIREQRYWSVVDAALNGAATATTTAIDDVRQEIVARLERAVRARLVADVPLGVYVSGGIDSSVLALLAAQDVGPELRTFSVEFDDPVFDESADQTMVRRWLGLENHTAQRISYRDIGEHFPDVVYRAERVLFRTGPLPLYLLSRHVQAAGVKVVLTGEGADEIFWGYPLFKEAKIRQFWRRNPESAWRPRLLERIFPFMPQYSRRYIHLLTDSYRASLPDSGALDTHWSRIRSCQHLKKFYSPQLQERLAGYDALADLESSVHAELEKTQYLRGAQVVEQATLLAGYLLCSQGDRMTMAHSVEARFPFLDHHLAEYVFALPDRLKLFGLKDKWILRRSFAGRLPAATVARPKHPYQAPDVKGFFYADGTVADCVADVLRQSEIERGGLFAWKVVDQFLHKLRTMAPERFSTQDNMALVQLLSAQLLSAQYERGFRGMRAPAMSGFPVAMRRAAGAAERT